MKIALIELGASHDECLYSQIKIIKSDKNIHLTLICNASLEENAKYFDLIDKKTFVTLRKGLKEWVDLYKLWRQCKIEKFDKIIFNTAQGKTISKFLHFPFGKQTKFYGTLHDTRKIKSSHSQKSISKKVKHYFILNEYLEQNIDKKDTEKLSFSVYHPFLFPNYPDLVSTKKDNEIWICIPGQVELKRRDYKSLFKSIEKHGLNKNIKFILLGRHGHTHGDGKYIKEEINRLDVEDQFLLWENFIPVETFHSMLRYSDYVLPIIHEGDLSGDLYKNQISGANNLAVGYKKPMLIETSMADEMSDYNPIVYDKIDLVKIINNLDLNKSLDCYNNKKWTFGFQKETYLKSLGM